MDELWHPTEINTLELAAFVEQSVRDGIFQFGGSDLHVEDVDGTIKFRLCHERDIHFESHDGA